MAGVMPVAPAPTIREEAVLLGPHGRLVGVVSDPAAPAGDRPAFVLLNAGLVHRVGPSRNTVRLARALAARGFLVLRFDNSAVGDSRLAGPPGDTSLAALEAEPRQAMDWLRERRGARRFVLGGLCSGALHGLRAARDAQDVAGLLLLGMPPPRDARRARVMARHYARLAFRSSFRGQSWRSLASLNVDLRRLAATAGGLAFGWALAARRDARPDTLPGDLQAARARGVRLLVLHAEGDEGLDHTRDVLAALPAIPGEPSPPIEVIRGADHQFTLASSQAALLEAVLRWAATLEEPLTARA